MPFRPPQLWAIIQLTLTMRILYTRDLLVTMRIDKVKWITVHNCGKPKWHSFKLKRDSPPSTLAHKMGPRKQTTEPKLLILVSFFSGEVTYYTDTSYCIHIIYYGKYAVPFFSFGPPRISWGGGGGRCGTIPSAPSTSHATARVLIIFHLDVWHREDASSSSRLWRHLSFPPISVFLGHYGDDVTLLEAELLRVLACEVIDSYALGERTKDKHGRRRKKWEKEYS